MRRSGTVALLLLGSLASFSPAAQAQWAPMPPPRHEIPPPPPPGPRAAWQNGGWDWNGRGYVWRPGHYVAWRPHHEWVPGHWGRRGRVWIPAHWR